MNFLKGLLLFIVAGCAIIFSLMLYADSPVQPGAPPDNFTISQGQNARIVGVNLKENGFVRSSIYFMLIARTSGASANLKTGTFEISPGMNTRDILELLTTTRGELPTTKVTVPEGFTARQIAARFEDSGLCNANELMDIVNNPAKYEIDTGGLKLNSLEGYLFPETYFLDNKSNCVNQVQRMVDQFFKIFNEKYVARAKEIGFSVQQTVVLASLIEKEARIDSDRPLVSGVLHNRLKINMLLQCDATIQYALPERKQKIYYKHLEIDSPYNTYKYQGLPPGAICSPGKASLEAALYPEKTKFYYYVAKRDGSHIFSTSNKEHVRAKQKIKREAKKN